MVPDPLMSTPQSLLQATLNRLRARMGSQLVDRAAEFAVFAQDAPQRLQQEWSLFWEEVELEARRLEKGDFSSTTHAASHGHDDPQDQIDALRAQVAGLTRKIDAAIRGGGQAGSI